jgi:hypothetical protein
MLPVRLSRKTRRAYLCAVMLAKALEAELSTSERY